ncbi:thioesterase family protein, partial [Nocardia puris]|nr:thioesterase family protein [Nocardia puris]
MTTDVSGDLDRSTATDAPFAAVCALTALPGPTPDAGRYRGVIDPVWTIGPKVHGGTMVAASAAAATAWLRADGSAPAGMAPIAASS